METAPAAQPSIEDRRAAGVAWVEEIRAAKDGTYWVTEYKAARPIRMHLVRSPYITAKGGYVQARSMDAFRDRQVKQFSLPGGRKIADWYSVEFDAVAVRIAIECGYEKLPLPHELPRTEYPDLWSFYEAIGWDHKRKRFVA